MAESGTCRSRYLQRQFRRIDIMATYEKIDEAEVIIDINKPEYTDLLIVSLVQQGYEVYLTLDDNVAFKTYDGVTAIK